MKNKSPFSFINIGSSSLLVVFLALCLVTFAILSLSTAKNDYEFSARSAERTTAYYEACNEAERIAAAFSRTLSEAETDGSVTDAAVTEIAGDQAEFDQTSGTLSYEVPVSDRQKLSVVLKFNDPSEPEVRYSVSRWQIVPTE